MLPENTDDCDPAGAELLRSDFGLPWSPRQDFAKHQRAAPCFAKRYQYAREALMDWYSEEVIKIAFDDSGDLIVDEDRVVAGHHVVQRARLKVDTVKWVMSKLAPKKYGDRPQVEEESKTLTISWQAVETPPPVAPSPQKQIEYRKPELPGDLTETDWSVILGLLEVVKSTIPSNDQSPPREIFEIMKEALLEHFRDKDEQPKKSRPPRGKKVAPN
jgi:hypothetical protein